MSYEVILLAAGQGRRMLASRNKILLHFHDKPVIAYSLERFLVDSQCEQIILVVKKDEEELLEEVLATYFSDRQKPVKLVIGGKERQDSVYQGLLHVSDLANYVMVHDGARPFVSTEILENTYAELEVSKAAIVGIPVKDTIKKVVNGKVEKTVPRDPLWQIQTPQGFIAEELLAAHKQAQSNHFLGTDDASLMEEYSQREISLVLGSQENIKLTTPEDLILGEALISGKKGCEKSV